MYICLLALCLHQVWTPAIKCGHFFIAVSACGGYTKFLDAVNLSALWHTVIPVLLFDCHSGPACMDIVNRPTHTFFHQLLTILLHRQIDTRTQSALKWLLDFIEPTDFLLYSLTTLARFRIPKPAVFRPHTKKNSLCYYLYPILELWSTIVY